MFINSENEDHKPKEEKFKKVQRSVYDLSSFGIKPPGINPFIKAQVGNNKKDNGV